MFGYFRSCHARIRLVYGYYANTPVEGEWTLSALMSQSKNGGISVGTFVNFVWVTTGEKF